MAKSGDRVLSVTSTAPELCVSYWIHSPGNRFFLFSFSPCYPKQNLWLTLSVSLREKRFNKGKNCTTAAGREELDNVRQSPAETRVSEERWAESVPCTEQKIPAAQERPMEGSWRRITFCRGDLMLEQARKSENEGAAELKCYKIIGNLCAAWG